MIFDTVPYCMAKRTHLLPRERQEIVDNIVKHLIPELRKNVEVLVGEYAITEVEIVKRVMETIDYQCAQRIPKPRWFAKFLFKRPCETESAS